MKATAVPLGKAVHTADDIVYLRLSSADKAEAKELAAAEGRTAASFIRAMYLRGVADYKHKLAILRQAS
jgi:hypothetical protein